MAIVNDAGDAALPSSTELALDRTLLAHDRTPMAWVTATSMISFGFTIYKFFQYLREHEGLEADGRVLGSRRFAMLMISIGLVSLLLATLQQLQLLFHRCHRHFHPLRLLQARADDQAELDYRAAIAQMKRAEGEQ
jgi:uncharacterized membrane protein YidH (DUF202 family)